MIQKNFRDIQFDRAARWLHNNAPGGKPPRHIEEKTDAQFEHLREALRAHLINDTEEAA